MPKAKAPSPEVLAENEKVVDFEEDLKKLNDIVDTLENGGLPLESALKAFESGVQLTRSCEKALATAEQRVKILSEQSVEAELVPFDLDDADA